MPSALQGGQHQLLEYRTYSWTDEIVFTYGTIRQPVFRRPM